MKHDLPSCWVSSEDAPQATSLSIRQQIGVPFVLDPVACGPQCAWESSSSTSTGEPDLSGVPELGAVDYAETALCAFNDPFSRILFESRWPYVRQGRSTR